MTKPRRCRHHRRRNTGREHLRRNKMAKIVQSEVRHTGLIKHNSKTLRNPVRRPRPSHIARLPEQRQHINTNPPTLGFDHATASLLVQQHQSSIRDTTSERISTRIRAKLPRHGRALPHRPRRCKRPLRSTHHINTSASAGRNNHLRTPMGTAWANLGQTIRRGRTQPGSKARLTCVNAWSGRRDSNPRPSPWQKNGYGIGWLRRLVPLSRVFPVGFSADSAESARFRERWFNALNEADLAESSRGVVGSPSKRVRRPSRTTDTSRRPPSALTYASSTAIVTFLDFSIATIRGCETPM